MLAVYPSVSSDCSPSFQSDECDWKTTCRQGTPFWNTPYQGTSCIWHFNAHAASHKSLFLKARFRTAYAVNVTVYDGDTVSSNAVLAKWNGPAHPGEDDGGIQAQSKHAGPLTVKLDAAGSVSTFGFMFDYTISDGDGDNGSTSIDHNDKGQQQQQSQQSKAITNKSKNKNTRTRTTATRWVRLPLESGGDLTVPCAPGKSAGHGWGDEVSGAVLSCRLDPLPSVTFNADGKPIVATAFPAGGGMCTCRVPPVNAAAGASVSFSSDNKTFVPAAVNVVFYATWSPSLGKRPYLSTDDSGSIVVITDKGAGGAGRIVCEEVELNAVVTAGATVALPFSLQHLPRTFDGFLNVTMLRKDGLPPLHRSLRLMRVPPKPAAVKSFSWLDYSRRAIMVNDAPLVPVGFYSTWPPAQGGFEGLLADLTGQAKQGVNVVMQYQGDASALNSSRSWNSDVGGCLVVMPGQLQHDCDNQTQLFLDHAAAVGVHVMVDLAGLFREIVCGQFAPNSKSCPAVSRAAGAGVRAGADPDAPSPPAGAGASANASASAGASATSVAGGPASGWAAVEKAVKRYQNHPALLGWYVCDDCMTSWIVAQRAAGTPTVDTMYNRLKQVL